jgi:hypothetical protein
MNAVLSARRGEKRNVGRGFSNAFCGSSLFFPGIFYSLWRRSGGGPGCPKCGSKALTPFDTPEGEAIMRKNLMAKGGKLYQGQSE